MKNFRKFVIFILCLISLGVCVSAHPGRTDENGGHYDEASGEYHYHHGYPAHQHRDIDGDGKLDCPYEFDDKTGQNSGSRTHGNRKNPNAGVTQSKGQKPGKSGDYSASKGKNRLDDTTIILGLFALFVVLLFIQYWIHEHERKKQQRLFEREKSQLEHKKQEYEKECERLNQMVESIQTESDIRIQELEQQLDNERKKSRKIVHDYIEDKNSIMKTMYGERYIYLLSGASSDDDLNEKLLPKQLNASENWGDRYTFYCGSSKRYGQYVYHTARCRFCNRQNPINAYVIMKNPSKYSACLACNPKLPNMEWVEKYQHNSEMIREILEETE